MRILLVEDHDPLASQVVSRIKCAGYEVDRVHTIEQAVGAIDGCAYSLTLLDRRLPDGDGVTLIRRMRVKQPKMRILVLSALDAVDDKIEGLEAGADDYLTKPFSLDEMIARIRAHLRGDASEPAPPITIGALSFDLERRTVTIANRQVQFARREFLLLEALLRRANCVVSRDTLHAEVYGHGSGYENHALTSLVSCLRVQLVELQAGAEIFPARGLGYLIRKARTKEK